MKLTHRLLVSFAVLLCLAASMAACGGESPTQGPVDAGPTETEMVPAVATPTDQPPPTEAASPSPVAESPLPTPTEPPQDESGGQAVSPIPTEIPPPEPVPDTSGAPQELLDAVIEDLLARISTSREAIAVEEAGPVVWRDGSLGCPEPGMMYTQALVPGYQIVLRAGGETFDYHASDWGHFVLCEEGRAEEPLPPSEGGGPVPVVDE